MYRRFGQRWLDLVLTVPALIVFTPVLAIVALLVRVRLGMRSCSASSDRACTDSHLPCSSSVR